MKSHLVKGREDRKEEMVILVTGVNHKTAPVGVRERLSLNDEALPKALTQLSNYIGEGIILSTCNRTEVYSVAEKTAVISQRISRFLSDISNLPPFVVGAFIYTHQREEAVRHLFRVACGLDSMILGEAQILGQVRSALETAQASGNLDLPLSNLFRYALRVGRRVRSDTEISRSAASVSSAAVEMAQKLSGNLGSATALVIGAGRMARRTAKTLVDKGASSVTVVNRTFERAAQLAAELDIEARPMEELKGILTSADIVVAATSSPGYILDSQLVAEAMSCRRNRVLYLIDIAVPRDIDPETKKLRNVFLRDIDDLKAVSEANLREREKEIAKVEAIIENQVAKFMAWWKSLDARPTVVALRHQAEAIRQREMAKTFGKLPDLSEEERSRIDALTNAIVNKILHQPMVHLKEYRNGWGYIEKVRELFGLKEETP